MALDLSTLGAYTKENITPLLSRAIMGAKTQQLIIDHGRLVTGVKSSVKIPQVSTDVILQNQSCGWLASGTTSISQREIKVGHIKISESICADDLKPYFTQLMLKEGANNENFGNAEFEQKYMELKTDGIAATNEVALWQGDTGSVNVNLNKYNGLIKLIDAGSPISANTGSLSGTPVISESNSLAIMKQMKNKIPAALKGLQTDPVLILCGYDTYDAYVDAGIAANMFHHKFDDKSNYGGLVIPGTNIRLEAVHGLDGTGCIYGMRGSNLCLGVDAVEDPENLDLWYSKDNQEHRFIAKYSIGPNVAFTQEVVVFKGTPAA